MPKKLIWERTTSKLQLYITQDRYELKTPLMTIPFTSKSKMMVYLQQRYHLDMQEYRQIYDAGFLTGTPVKKEDIKMTASSFKPIKEENLQKRNGSELAQKNQEEAREKITTLAKNFEADPSTLADYLQFGSRFYKYSPKNILLLYAQNPFATYIQSFENWKKEGCSVLKGEHGLKVWVPVSATFIDLGNGNKVQLSKATKEQKEACKEGKLPSEKRLVSFRLGTTFDISQTNFPKERYPELFNMGFNDGDQRMLCNAISDFCQKQLGYKVSYDTDLRSISLRGACNRLTKEITLNPKLNDSQRLSTLTHEMGHAILHGESNTKGTFQKEFEADAISIMFLGDLGIKPSQSRIQHLSQSYNRLKKEFSESLDTVSEESFDESVQQIFAPVFDTYKKYVDHFYQEVNASLEKQHEMEKTTPLSVEQKALIKDCSSLLLQEYPSLSSDTMQDFLKDDLQLRGGEWMQEKLNEYLSDKKKPSFDQASQLSQKLHSFSARPKEITKAPAFSGIEL